MLIYHSTGTVFSLMIREDWLTFFFHNFYGKVEMGRDEAIGFVFVCLFSPRQVEIGVGADLHIKYVIDLLKAFPPSPQYPVYLVAE